MHVRSHSQQLSPSQAASSSLPPSHSHEEILFPRVFEDAWGAGGLAGDRRTDLERARIFLLRFANMSADPILQREIKSIITDRQHLSVASMATAVQMRIMGDRHAGFEATPLLQCIRFMLIKAGVPEFVPSERHRPLIDFFFDPTLARTADPAPADPVVYRYPAGRLKVAIVGGGPTALASAISLAEKGCGRVEVHVYERRWIEVPGGGPEGRTRVDYPPTARRRDQVVTLQESVTDLLSGASRQALFRGRPERVWPGSANIQIRKVEDRFLERCQDPEFRGLIHLHARSATRDNIGDLGDFHVLLGADGAASWVRGSYFQGYEKERGRSYALGLAFDRPTGLPWPQPLNVFLTLGQTRYLLNASDFDGRGYLNMQLTEDEWQEMVDAEGNPVTFGNPGCLRGADGSVPDGFEERQVLRPSEDREGPLWRAIADGLKLFGFKESEVVNVVRIPIVVQAVAQGARYLPPQDCLSVRRPHALVAVAGDAAMTVHFWPGRGLNSGIKSGLALGDEVVHALNEGRFVGLRLDAMAQYDDFIMKLQAREHDRRSIPILNQSGSPEMLGWLLAKASAVPDHVAVEWLVGATAQIAERLEQRPDWPFGPVANLEPQLRIVLRQLEPATLREMAVSFPWPTREMGGAEVLPIRSMKPEEKQRWLQGLWALLKDELGRDAKKAMTAAPSPSPAPSRFEAPRGLSPARMESTLRRSNATRAISPGPSERNLAVPGASMNLPIRPRSSSPSPSTSPSRFAGQSLVVPDENVVSPISPRSRSPSPSPGGDFGLERLLSVKRPGRAVLTDAMSLALFRVEDV